MPKDSSSLIRSFSTPVAADISSNDICRPVGVGDLLGDLAGRRLDGSPSASSSTSSPPPASAAAP
jgi:hypothetical protein